MTETIQNDPTEPTKHDRLLALIERFNALIRQHQNIVVQVDEIYEECRAVGDATASLRGLSVKYSHQWTIANLREMVSILTLQVNAQN